MHAWCEESTFDNPSAEEQSRFIGCKRGEEEMISRLELATHLVLHWCPKVFHDESWRFSSFTRDPQDEAGWKYCNLHK